MTTLQEFERKNICPFRILVLNFLWRLSAFIIKLKKKKKTLITEEPEEQDWIQHSLSASHPISISFNDKGWWSCRYRMALRWVWGLTRRKKICFSFCLRISFFTKLVHFLKDTQFQLACRPKSGHLNNRQTQTWLSIASHKSLASVALLP